MLSTRYSTTLFALMALVILARPLSGNEPSPASPAASGQERFVTRTWLGFNSEPVTDAEKQALLRIHAQTIRVGGHMDSWRSDSDYALWDREATFVDWAVEHQIRPVYLLCYSPYWANAETRRKYKYPHDPSRPWEDSFCPPDDPADWKKIVKATMERYKGKIFDYEVWNEANSGFYFRGPLEGDARAELTRRYVELCRVTHEAAREVDPKIKVFTCGPHNDFFGSFLNQCFDLGVANYSDGLVLHIYVGPQSMAGFDVWWGQYMNVIDGLEARAGKKFPLALTEYGHNHDDRPERGGAYSLAQNTALLASRRVELANQFTFYHPDAQHRSYGVFTGNFEDNVTTKTLRHLFGLFKDATYQPLKGAAISPPGDSTHVLGTPRTPDNKFYALELTKSDGKKFVYVASWRGRFDYSKGALVDIPDMTVTIRLPGRYAGAQEIDTKTGDLKPFAGFAAEGDSVKFDLPLEGIQGGVEGWPRAFIFEVAP